MPDKRFLQICAEITQDSGNSDPARITALIDELIELLKNEQDVIKSNIRANLMNRGGDLPY